MALVTFQDLPSTSTSLNATNLNNNFNWVMNGGGWITLPLATGIEQYSSDDKYKCQYRKIGNQVFVRGCVKGASANNTTLATLPTGYRPSTTARYVNGYNPIKGGTILTYETDGDIIFVGYTSNTTVTSTDFLYIQTSFFVD